MSLKYISYSFEEEQDRFASKNQITLKPRHKFFQLLKKEKKNFTNF